MAADGSVLIKILGDASEFSATLKGLAGKGLSIAAKSFAALEGAIVASGAASVVFGAQYETATKKLDTIVQASGGTAQATQELSDKLVALSDESGESATALADVAYNAISAGTSVEDAAGMAETATKLATAGFTNSESALSLLTTTINSYGDSAGTAQEISDSLLVVQNKGVTTIDQLASVMGKAIATGSAYNVDLANLESSYISLTKAGISTEESTTYLSSMMSELGDSGSKVGKVIQSETGKSFGELMKDGRSLGDVLKVVSDSCGGNSEAMMQLWGSTEAGKAANAIASQGLDTFNDNLTEVKNSAGATQKAYASMEDTLEHKAKKLKTNFKNLGLTIYKHIKGNLKDAADAGLRWIERLQDQLDAGKFDSFFDAISDAIQGVAKIIPKIGDAFMKILPIASKVGSAFVKVLEFTLDHIELVIGAIGGIGTAFAGLKIASVVSNISRAITGFKGAATAIGGVNTALKIMGITMTVSTGGLVAAGIAVAAALAGIAIAVANTTPKTDANVESTKKLVDEYKEMREEFNLSKEARENNIKAAEVESGQADILADKVTKLSEKEHKSASEKKLLSGYVEQLNDLMPDLNAKYDEEADKLNISTQALKDNVEAQKESNIAKAAQEQLTSISSDMVKNQLEQDELSKKATSNQKAYNKQLAITNTAKRKYDKEVDAHRNGAENKADLDSAKLLYQEESKTLEKKKNALKTSEKALETSKKQAKSLEDEYSSTEKIAEESYDKAEVIQSLSEITAECKKKGVEIPKAVSDGIKSGKYVVPDSVDGMQNLISFNKSVEKAKLGGTQIPHALAEKISSGEISVKDAMTAMKNLATFDGSKEAAAAGAAGVTISGSLRKGIASGKITVEQAKKQLENATKFSKTAVVKNAGGTGTALFKALSKKIQSGKISVEEATALLQKKTEFDNADIKKKARKSAKEQYKNIESGLKSGKYSVKEASKMLAELVDKYTKAKGTKKNGSDGIKDYNKGQNSKKKAVKSTSKSIGEASKQSLKDGSSGTYSIGWDIISGVIDGLTGNLPWLRKAALSAAKSAYNAMCNFLDINSPSKKFRDGVGKPISEGVAVGIEKGRSWIDDSAEKVVGSAFTTAVDSASDFSDAIPAAQKAIAANFDSISAKAKIAVQNEIGRVTAAATLQNNANIPTYNDQKVVALLDQLVTEAKNGKQVVIPQRTLGEAVNSYNRKMVKVIGGS